MRHPAAVCLLALSACASSGPSQERRAQESVRIVGTSGTSSLRMSDAPVTETKRVPFSLEDVWRILPSVYDSLKIPIGTLEPSTRVIGNEGVKVRRQLGGVSLSRYLDCGTTQIGPNADSYEVYLTVLTQIRKTPATEESGTDIATTVEARARPISFNQAYSRCATNRALEARIMDLIRKRLAQ